jgi:hypothetical protein
MDDSFDLNYLWEDSSVHGNESIGSTPMQHEKNHPWYYSKEHDDENKHEAIEYEDSLVDLDLESDTFFMESEEQRMESATMSPRLKQSQDVSIIANCTTRLPADMHSY